MAQFKPQVTYMTSKSLHDYRAERYRNISPYKTEIFNTYGELKKALRDRILHEHIGEDEVFVTRSRRGEWGEWFEHWQKTGRKKKIVKQGWQ